VTVAITHDDDWRDALMNVCPVSLSLCLPSQYNKHEVPLTEQEFMQAIFARFEIMVEDGEVFIKLTLISLTSCRCCIPEGEIRAHSPGEGREFSYAESEYA
jgi:hypothetical protein